MNSLDPQRHPAGQREIRHGQRRPPPGARRNLVGLAGPGVLLVKPYAVEGRGRQASSSSLSHLPKIAICMYNSGGI